MQVRLLHHSVARLESMPLPSDYDDRRMLESWQDNVRGSDAWLVGRRGPEWWTGEAHTTLRPVESTRVMLLSALG
jgi:hypothetical protein